MTAACKQHYLELHKQCGIVLEKTFESPHGEEMAKAHAFIADIALWIGEISPRPEKEVLAAALREYQFALLALALGQYRDAFSSIRLFLELCFATVQFSANERELREWMKGQRDTIWVVLIDVDNGILSKQFLRLFSEGLADEAPSYRTSAGKVYRECSEYVHGNANTRAELPEGVVFHEALFTAWHSKASVIRHAALFALTARYLSDMDIRARSRLEGILLDHLGHSAGVRAILGAPMEAANV